MPWSTAAAALKPVVAAPTNAGAWPCPCRAHAPPRLPGRRTESVPLFALHTPWWELVLRGVLVYLAILLFMRLSARREVGEFTPFDLAVLLILSEAVSPALTGEEQSVTGGLVVVAVLLAMNWGMGEISLRFRRAERLLEGEPIMIIRNGKVMYRQLRRNRITRRDLLSALRQQGCLRPSEVELAVLEPNGSISVKKRGD